MKMPSLLSRVGLLLMSVGEVVVHALHKGEQHPHAHEDTEPGPTAPQQGHQQQRADVTIEMRTGQAIMLPPPARAMLAEVYDKRLVDRSRRALPLPAGTMLARVDIPAYPPGRDVRCAPALASGVVGHCRVAVTDGPGVHCLTVTGPNGDGDVVFDNNIVVAGGIVAVPC